MWFESGGLWVASKRYTVAVFPRPEHWTPAYFANNDYATTVSFGPFWFRRYKTD